MNRTSRLKSPALFAALILLLLATHSAAQAPSPREVTIAETLLFGSGKELYTTGRPLAAIKTFKLFTELHPGSEITDLVILWQGRASLTCGDFGEANRLARRLRQLKSVAFADVLDAEINKGRSDGIRRRCDDDGKRTSPRPLRSPAPGLNPVGAASLTKRHKA